jgi:hypothetical protein
MGKIGDRDRRPIMEGKEDDIMGRPIKRREPERGEKIFEQKLARLRATSAERAQVLASASPFDYEAWVREAGPATREELAEMEEFLREREAERQQSVTFHESQY